MATKCPKCQADNPETATFCADCGIRLSLHGAPSVSVTKTLISPAAEGSLVAGRYKILGKLGEGGMGVVYKAEDTRLKRIVALKLMPAELTRDSEAKERFIREAQAAAALSHPNICTIHEIDEEDGQSFISMEFVEGQSVRERIKKRPTDIGEALGIAIQAAQGLEEAHKKGIIHRDIKSANIMVTQKGQAKVMDFGLAKVFGASLITKEAKTMGTVAYMSPEQAQGQSVDHRTDIWSLGVVLYEMLSGKLPFKGEFDQSMIYSILHHEPEPLTKAVSKTPKALENVVLTALAKNPADRYQSMAELLEDLKAISEGLKPVRAKVGLFRGRVLGIERAYAYPAIICLIIIFVLADLFIFPKRGQAYDSIAVLPFRYLAEDKEKEYWADAMTGELIGRLAQVSGLKKVISMQSAMQYKDSAKKAPEIGRELRVNCLVEGSILRVEDRIKISVQLIEANTDSHLWAGEYERNGKDIYALQNEVTMAIVSEIKVKLTPQEEMRLAKIRPVSLEAYDSLIKTFYSPPSGHSMEEVSKITEEGFKKIIQQDPDFAPPYAALALAYWNKASMLYTRSYDGYLQAKHLAERALELDDSIGMAHAILGSIKAVIDYDWAGTQKEMDIAKSLYPNDALVFAIDSVLHHCTGQFDEAVASANRAIELEPLLPSAKFPLGLTYYCSRRYDEALEVFNEIVGAVPDQSFDNLYVLRCYVAKNLRQEALGQAVKIMTLPDANQDAQILATVGFAYGTLGEKTQAQSYLDMLNQVAQKKYVDPQLFARIYVGLGDAGHALEYLEKALEERSDLTELKTDPLWDSINNEPRFQAILKKVGLA